mgnify:FL=1
MISFIIPAYNARKTIGKAIESILNQEKSDIDYEVIVVDDGSNDNLKDELEKYENKIRYFYKENSGVSDARNLGVKMSKGEYIIFVDSDDYISRSLLKDIQEYINKKIELIKWNPVFVDADGNRLKQEKSVKFEIVTGEEGFNLLFGKDNLIDCLWNYAIKKSLMMKFPSKMYHEDFRTMPLMILKAKSMVSIDKYEYFYVQSQNSIMRNTDIQKEKKKIEDKITHYDNIMKELEKMNLNKRTKENVAIFITNSLLTGISDLNEENRNLAIKELKRRKVAKNIKIRNFKQLIKRIILEIKY